MKLLVIIVRRFGWLLITQCYHLPLTGVAYNSLQQVLEGKASPIPAVLHYLTMAILWLKQIHRWSAYELGDYYEKNENLLTQNSFSWFFIVLQPSLLPGFALALVHLEYNAEVFTFSSVFVRILVLLGLPQFSWEHFYHKISISSIQKWSFSYQDVIHNRILHVFTWKRFFNEHSVLFTSDGEETMWVSKWLSWNATGHLFEWAVL